MVVRICRNEGGYANIVGRLVALFPSQPGGCLATPKDWGHLK
ncbi:hypothetical protein GCM10027446_14650 [Angustibacter peucedani]